MSDAHRICSGGTSESRLSWSSGVQVELSKIAVDALKADCPGYAVMRPLMLGFRSLLRQPTTPSQKARTPVALHQWLDRAHATGIASIQNFVCQLMARSTVRSIA